MEDAVQTVMMQCELWTDNTDMQSAETNAQGYEQGQDYAQSNAKNNNQGCEDKFDEKFVPINASGSKVAGTSKGTAYTSFEIDGLKVAEDAPILDEE